MVRSDSRGKKHAVSYSSLLPTNHIYITLVLTTFQRVSLLVKVDFPLFRWSMFFQTKLDNVQTRAQLLADVITHY